MGNSNSSSPVTIKNINGNMELETPDQNQYIFFPKTTDSCKFKVRAHHDAHIALSTNAKDAPLYEVILGGSNNTMSGIKHNGSFLTQAKIANILKADVFCGFWIRWENRNIMVGHENDSNPFLRWSNKDYIYVNYIGVRTTNGATGTWIISQKIEEKAHNENIGASCSNSRKNTEEEYIPNFTNTKDTFIHCGSEADNKTVNNEKETFSPENKDHETQNKKLNNDPIERISQLIKNDLKTLNVELKNVSKCENEEEPCTSNITPFEHRKLAENKKDGKRRHSRYRNVTKNKQSQINIQNGTDLMEFIKLVEISKQNPELMVIELKDTNFELLFESKLTQGYIVLLTQMLSKLCDSELIHDKAQIIKLFSKEIFLDQLINYLYNIPSQSEKAYKKHSVHMYNFWHPLFKLCHIAFQENLLSNSCLLTLLNASEVTLKALAQMGRKTAPNIAKDEFYNLKGKLKPGLENYTHSF